MKMEKCRDSFLHLYFILLVSHYFVLNATGEIITFQEFELLKKVCTYERVTEIQQESTEIHPLTVDIDGVWAGADIADRHLKPKSKTERMFCFKKTPQRDLIWRLNIK